METEEQFETCAKVCKKHDISAIIIIGGDDSNTNAAVLAEYFLQKKHDIQVIGCPKTIDGDLKNESIEISFGFDTATKTYAELVGNIARDANSAKKYWHFIRLMGRSASHISLEVALQTQPNFCLIGEEIGAKNQSLDEVVDELVQIIAARADDGNYFEWVWSPKASSSSSPRSRSDPGDQHPLAKEEKTFGAIADDHEKIRFVTDLLSKASPTSSLPSPKPSGSSCCIDRDLIWQRPSLEDRDGEASFLQWSKSG